MTARPDHQPLRVTLDDLYGEEAAAWMRLSPQQRWVESMRLAAWHHALGGTSDPDPDPASPFHDPDVRRARPVDGGQACVLYGAAEYSRDLDLAVLATPEALNHDDMDVSLAAEQARIMAEDRAYWAPLRRELEALRFKARRTRE